MPRTLRRTVDVVSVLAVAGLIAFISYESSEQLHERRVVQGVAADLDRFRQLVAYKAASNQTEVNPRGWPTTIDPQWFNGDPPRNPLVSPEHPWLEVATPAEASLNDPPMRMTVSRELASFWYNPYQGIIRARVPVSISDAKALRLYNAINQTNLDSVYGPIPQPVQAAQGATGSTGASGAPESSKTTASVPEDNLDPTIPREAAPPAPILKP